MAQTLRLGVRYIAEWGGYQIEIDTRHTQTDILVTIRQNEAPYSTFATKRASTPDAALQWAARWLEENFCGAFVNGERRALGDFLFFVSALGGVSSLN